MPFVDNCYLIKHAQGWMLWDTGLTDALAAQPEGQKPASALRRFVAISLHPSLCIAGSHGRKVSLEDWRRLEFDHSSRAD
jgi:hypothetical protein